MLQSIAFVGKMAVSMIITYLIRSLLRRGVIVMIHIALGLLCGTVALVMSSVFTSRIAFVVLRKSELVYFWGVILFTLMKQFMVYFRIVP